MNQKFKKKLKASNKSLSYFDIKDYAKQGNIDFDRLPFSIRILFENQLRKLDNYIVKKNDVDAVATWKANQSDAYEIAFFPSRVIMQDFTGVPAVVDFAAMRNAIKRVGSEATKINPQVPADLVVDHSIQTDYFGTDDAMSKNMEKEFYRNSERYKLLKWAQKSLNNFRIFPPASGIIHQINLEYLGQIVLTQDNGDEKIAYLDSCIGTDSHTVMINGLGVMGWGVGGIEAEATMLGQPYYMKIPEVVGVNLKGELSEGVTATDLVLTIVQRLREENVVEKFVEYFGEGYKELSLNDRAVLANMGPEYGATMGYCPIDSKTIDFLKTSNRGDIADLVEEYTKAIGLFYDEADNREYSKIVDIDLSVIEPSIAGHKRPQDKIVISNIVPEYNKILKENFQHEQKKSTTITVDSTDYNISDGVLAIASITSCTNTSNPALVLGAALTAKNAVERGLTVPKYVKTSFGPGSKVVSDYLDNADLQKYFDKLGFNVVGYGCLTCIGNSGPINKELENSIQKKDIIASCSVSSNRNFEARVHQNVKTNFLASPILVVAYALAGRIDIDLTKESLGKDKDGNDVYFRDIVPKNSDIQKLVESALSPELFKKAYENVFEGTKEWQKLNVKKAETFDWDLDSTYIRNPSFFEEFELDMPKITDIKNARPLLILGDSVTTDHISPAGAIPKDYPAGRYLLEHGVDVADFNSYGSRRGNHEVMMRGTFANVRIKNKMTNKEGGYTKKYPENKDAYVFDAAMDYKKEGTSLIVVAGKEYGTGSSRDWAAKGTYLLGVKAVIAESYERIHRSNLIGMGILPLVFVDGDNCESLGIKGDDTFTISGIDNIKPGEKLEVKATRSNGDIYNFSVKARLDTVIDVHYYKNGGILQSVMRDLAKK